MYPAAGVYAFRGSPCPQVKAVGLKNALGKFRKGVVVVCVVIWDLRPLA